ncbi:C-type lectin protein [Collybia nuda]|uniref:C-type lectin protein n=1 Tax=Collybia nuda TaxID=64659 RepID=A0A9P5YD62_9AGAR|nr:C-type lectin protein [Collybia nuda]
MSSPGSSSSSSYESSFDPPGSRATTPSSIISDNDKLSLDSYFPNAYVCLSSPSVTPDVVKTLFIKHSAGNRLGLYIPLTTSGSQLTSAFGSWTKQSIFSREIEIEYIFAVRGSPLEELDCSRRLSTEIVQHLHAFSISSFRAVISLATSNGAHVLHILEQPTFAFSPLSCTPAFSTSHVSSLTTQGNIPTVDEWKMVWSAWDTITLKMIPQEMLHQKPIDLRHKCLFYIGHIPTFLDMLISKSIGGGPSEPKHFWNIFERGIDPHVDDPDHCHNHSEVPEADEDWPTLESIMGFRNSVRARLFQLYDDLQSGKRVLTRNIARTLVMTLEHEGFHVETLLYMLIQRAGTGTLPPPGFTSPPWELLTQQWNANPTPLSSTVTLGPATITLGHNDSEGDDKKEGVSESVEGHVFGWDNESPERKVEVGTFRVDWRPVSNRDFEVFWRETGATKLGMPGSWVEEDGHIKVRTMYGPVSMEIAQHWPVLTSYDHLMAYANSKGGHLPTEPELRLFLDTYDVGHEGGANIGFRNWHPVPPTAGLAENSGMGSNGGVWEWTSTTLDNHEGLSPTNLFTGYSTDFFDDKHQVVLGASYATIPRLAGRKTVRNFYQHNYPYPWVGGRVVYDS